VALKRNLKPESEAYTKHMIAIVDMGSSMLLRGAKVRNAYLILTFFGSI
jgi:hypothetical protein